MNKNVTIIIALGLTFAVCSPKSDSRLGQIVDELYQVYNKRTDQEKFAEFYDENIILEDLINGDRIRGKEALLRFFDWKNPNFMKLDSNNLMVTEKIIEEDKAVIKGYFGRFKWGEVEFEAMHFTTILTFNDSGKIVKQVDWINYPTSLVDYNKRKNSNHWIE